jgi:signal transduction histidine kinase
MGEGDLTARAPVDSHDEIGQVARQFNRMAERLQSNFTELGSERDALRRFIADASHELRTPITALKTFTDLLQGVAATDQRAQAEFLAESAAQVRRLEWITQNLLDLSRLDAGLIQLDRQPVDLAKLSSEALAPFRPRAEEEGLTLALDVPEAAPALSVDAPRLQIALSNLLDNAIRHAAPGSTVTLSARTLDGERVALAVHNAGEAIPAEDLPHIFDRFYRTGSARQNQRSGSGLGLSIVKAIAEAHNGYVEVFSELGQGTTFRLWLPALHPAADVALLPTDERDADQPIESEPESEQGETLTVPAGPRSADED